MKNTGTVIVKIQGGSRGEIDYVGVEPTVFSFEEYCQLYAEKVMAEYTDMMTSAGYTPEEIADITEEYSIGHWEIETSKSGVVHCMVCRSSEEVDDLILASTISAEHKFDLLAEPDALAWEDVYEMLSY